MIFDTRSKILRMDSTIFQAETALLQHWRKIHAGGRPAQALWDKMRVSIKITIQVKTNYWHVV